MKKYYSLGELLTDFRQLNNQTQSDMAALLAVDVRTIARWENNETLIKPDKVEAVVETTFIPYQVIHNLNAVVPLPVYYDFSIRKYSLTELQQVLPTHAWFRESREIISERMHPISTDKEIEHIVKYHNFLYPTDRPVNPLLIKHAVRLLPDLNYVMYDMAGFYAGHHVVFPIGLDTLQKLRNREMIEGELRETQLVNYKTTKPITLYGYSFYADCNENFFYVLAKGVRFLKGLAPDDYVYGALLVRPDALKLAEQMGLRKIWEDKEEQSKLGMRTPPASVEGKFNDVFLGE